MISKASIQKKGYDLAIKNSKAKSPNVQKDFKNGMEKFAEHMAGEFVRYIADRMEENYELPVLGITMTKKELLNTISKKEKVVTIFKGKTKEFSYWEIWRYFEYGRMDQGVIADPVLKKIFIEFKPLYVEALKKELKKKPKK